MVCTEAVVMRLSGTMRVARGEFLRGGSAASTAGSFLRRGGWGTFRGMSSQRYCPFPNTHWSLVRRAGASGGESQGRREALGVLLARYEPALMSYLRVVRWMGDEAEDVLQAFFADKFLERDMLRHADERRGRFRTFLLTSLNNFVASWHRAAGAKVRAAGRLEEAMAEGLAAAGGTAGAEVEAAWARALIQDVVGAMREKCREEGREDVWAVFEGRVLAEIFEEREPVGYEELARRLGLRSPTQAANLLVTGKRLFGRLMRVAVSEYERDEVDIEAEIGELRAILSAVKSRHDGK